VSPVRIIFATSFNGYSRVCEKTAEDNNVNDERAIIALDYRSEEPPIACAISFTLRCLCLSEVPLVGVWGDEAKHL